MGHFYFIRHGQTVWNVANKICGATDIELTEKEADFLPENVSIKGHEFHYFDSTANGDGCVALKPVSGKKYDCIFDKKTIFVGFPHLYYPSAPRFAENFVKKAKNYKLQKSSSGSVTGS